MSSSAPGRGLPSDDAPPAPIAVLPAAAERWPDVETLLGGDQDRGCWCQYWRLSSSAYAARGPGAPVMRARLDRQPAPGMLAFIGTEVVGWCGIGPDPPNR